ncbi:helix-turn-helix transcriptional regulator [Streptomyces sp. NPDC055210]
MSHPTNPRNVLHRPQRLDREAEDGPVLGRAVADALGSVAREVLTTSPEAAAKLAIRALELAGPDSAAGATHIMTVIDARLAVGELEQAIALLRETLSKPLPPHLAAKLRSRLVHGLLASGHAVEAVEVVDLAPDLPDEHSDATSTAGAAFLLALSLSDPQRARAEATKRLHAPVRGNLAATASAKSTLADLAWEDGDAAYALRMAAEAVRDTDTVDSPIWRAHTRLAYARKLVSVGTYSRAEGLLKEIAGEFNQLGPGVHLAIPAIVRARLLTHQGGLAEAAAEACSALKSARETDAQLLSPLACYALANVHLRKGDLSTAEHYTELCTQPEVSRATPFWSMHVDWVETRLTAERQGAHGAVELLATRHTHLAEHRSLFLDEPGAAAWLVRTGRAGGGTELARRALRTAQDLAERNPGVHQVVVSAQHAKALFERDVDSMTRLVADHHDQWARACAIEDLAGCLAGPPRTDLGRAARWYQAALEVFERIDAGRDAERVRTRLRGLGVSPVPEPDSRHKTWEGFTENERIIAILVSEGFTNDQVANRVSRSQHTVNYHLRKVFQKFGINSRVQLARIVNEILRTSGVLHFLLDNLM